MEEIGTLEKIDESGANDIYKIEYTEALGLEGGDRQVAYPKDFTVEDIAGSIHSDLEKTGIIESKEKRKADEAEFYRNIVIENGTIKAEHVQLSYPEKTEDSTTETSTE